MKTFREFVTEAAADLHSAIEKMGFKDTKDRRGYGADKDPPVYTPQKKIAKEKIAALAAKHGYKRVTHYASGGPDSRMPDSAPHVYKKEGGYGGSENLTVHHDGTHIKHVLMSSSRPRD